jgi:hypothetical protein
MGGGDDEGQLLAGRVFTSSTGREKEKERQRSKLKNL